MPNVSSYTYLNHLQVEQRHRLNIVNGEGCSTNFANKFTLKFQNKTNFKKKKKHRMEQEHYFVGHAVSFALSNDLGARELGENFNPLFVRSCICLFL